jgi:serine/threonine-protein kinase
VVASSSAPAVSSAPPPATPTHTSTPTPTTVDIEAADFKGKTADQARAILQGFGMVADVREGTVAPTPDDVGKVYDVNPTGNLTRGQTVTVKIYAAIPTPATPAKPAVTAPPAGPNGSYPPATKVTVSWDDFQGCPTNTTLTAYRLSVNGDPYSGNPIPATTRSVQITLGPTPGETTVSYLAECSGIQSPPSPDLTITTALVPSP